MSLMKNNSSLPKQTKRTIQKKIFQRKEQSRQDALEWAANKKPSTLRTSVKEFTNINGNTMSYSLNEIKVNALTRVEQDFDIVLKNIKLKILGQHYEEVLLRTDRKYKQWITNEDRVILKNGLLFRKYYGETGSVKYYQNLIPKQLVDELACT